MEITQQILKHLFTYCEDGTLIRNYPAAGKNNGIGTVIGRIPKPITRNNRYVTTTVFGKHYSVHKLIYMFHYGEMPKQLDHINTNSIDNRIENLRPVTKSENARNRKLMSNNTSGFKGVSWNKNTQKWFVYVNVDKKRKNIGYFEDLELADLVATEARDKYHGKYANHI